MNAIIADLVRRDAIIVSDTDIVIADRTTVTVVNVSGPQGPAGAAGATGATGPTGPQGPAGLDLHYAHEQSVASAMWTVNHSLGKFPSVTVVDSSGREVEGDVSHTNVNQTVLTFGAAFAGKAYLN